MLSFSSVLAQTDLPCIAMAQARPFDQLLESGHSLLSGYSPEDCACFGEYFAKKHIAEGKTALLDSEWVPIFDLKGFSQCQLAEYNFDYRLVPDLFLSAEDRPKARAYMERYNALMLYELKEQAGDVAYREIFEPPEVIDPYFLRQRLDLLVRYGQITRNNWVNDTTIWIRFDLGPIYRNLNLDWKKLRFEIIDENKENSQVVLSLEGIDKGGFPLRINSKSRKSNVWFDFKIRIDYSLLRTDENFLICDRIKEYIFQYEHLSLTKNLRLISHLH